MGSEDTSGDSGARGQSTACQDRFRRCRCVIIQVRSWLWRELGFPLFADLTFGCFESHKIVVMFIKVVLGVYRNVEELRIKKPLFIMFLVVASSPITELFLNLI